MPLKKIHTICEENAYRALFSDVAPLLRNFLYAKTGKLQEAEDLMQEAFLKLWENCQKVNPENAKAYVFSIGKNLFLNTKTREKVIIKFKKTIPKEEQVSSSPHDELVEKEFAQKLEKAIASLSPNSKEVFLLNRIEGKKYREIAELLGISIKTVEKRMHKALVELRKIHQSI